MPAGFPGVGCQYLADFGAFKAALNFTSSTSLTYTVIAADGTPGTSKTVVIRTEELRADLFLVTWQEADKTTVVHIEDYENKVIITNITNPDGSFEQFHGTFTTVMPTRTAGIGTASARSI